MSASAPRIWNGERWRPKRRWRRWRLCASQRAGHAPRQKNEFVLLSMRPRRSLSSGTTQQPMRQSCSLASNRWGRSYLLGRRLKQRSMKRRNNCGPRSLLHRLLLNTRAALCCNCELNSKTLSRRMPRRLNALPASNLSATLPKMRLGNRRMSSARHGAKWPVLRRSEILRHAPFRKCQRGTKCEFASMTPNSRSESNR